MASKPLDVLASVLVWLEERIDLAHLAEVEQRHRDAMNWRPLDRPPVSIKGADVVQFPRYPRHEEFDDPVKMMVNQLAHPLDELVPGLASSVLLKDDFPLQIQANHGVGIIASVFGAESRILGNGMPWVQPLGGPEKVAALLDRGVPDLNGGLLPKVLDTMSFYREKLAEYPKCNQAIHIIQPDLQGCMDILHLLWGSGFFLYFYDAPDLLHSLLDLIAETYIAVLKKISPYTTEQASEGCIYLHWALCRGRFLLKNDTPIMLSPEMYAEFVRPHDEKIFREFGEGGIHFCASGDHWREEFAATKGLSCVDYGQPDHNDMDAWYETLKKRRIAIMRLPYPSESITSAEYKERFPTGVSFSTWASSLEEGQRIMEAVRSHK